MGAIGIVGCLLAARPALADPTGAFVPVGSMVLKRGFPIAVSLPDGTVLVAGGTSFDKNNNFYFAADAERFDPKTGKSTPVAKMAFSRSEAQAVRLLDGRVLVMFGAGSNNSTRSAELFDPATNAFTTVGNSSKRAMYRSATLLQDGRVLVVGGIDQSEQTLTTAELFNPATGMFEPTGSLVSSRRALHAAVALPDGRVVVLGGGRTFNSEPLRSVEIYDPKSGTFTVQGATVEQRLFATAHLLPNGRILLTGGLRGSAVSNTVEIYDPATGQSQITGTLSAPRWRHTSVTLGDGRVLVAGGISQDNEERGVALKSADIVDPTTGLVTPAPEMERSRAWGASLSLPDGRALLIGGYVRWGGVGGSAVVDAFDPTIDRAGP